VDLCVVVCMYAHFVQINQSISQPFKFPTPSPPRLDATKGTHANLPDKTPTQ
jgi:hypothetical protein